ncbi:MAG TPA: hypothetical protein VHZ95_08945, partial [Polyangiales bacterium]|nr:hypothetical protein [Polyangiales bacterium]
MLRRGFALLTSRFPKWLVVLWTVVSLGVACGRTPIQTSVRSDAAVLTSESCNGLDDDGDSKVDEDFRDSEGRYIATDHCGSCDRTCESGRIVHASAQDCGLIDGIPTCVATACSVGFAVSISGSCASLAERICMPCDDDRDCGSLPGARCVDVGDGNYCSITCDDGCPDGYACRPSAGSVCLPSSGDCACGAGDDYARACALTSPSGARCPGRQQCSNGDVTACQADVELCDGLDNDCDGMIDEGFLDARGAYSLDVANCGSCGVDCRDNSLAGEALVCGGDPFAPTCVVNCPDSANGIQVGDHLDADRRLDDGCECTVTSLIDSPGAPTTEGALDSNCDGADGDVLHSVYVAVDGDDQAPGSPTRPVRTIGRGIDLAFASLATSMPRANVFVASGTYTEVMQLRDGVQVHGGYRRD